MSFSPNFNLFTAVESELAFICLSGVQMEMENASMSTKCVISVLTVLITQTRPLVQRNVTSKLITVSGKTLKLGTDMTGSEIRVKHHPSLPVRRLITRTIARQVSGNG